MQVFPIHATEWLKYKPGDRKHVHGTSSTIPINDVFYPHFGKRERIRLFYGGYGSGKSVFIAQDLIGKCLLDPYFKCYYGRKVFANVHHSCFETIIETIEDLGLESRFKYSRADNSSMVIRCLHSGNMFIPFGCDRADKLKSIKDPTHIWCEEFDQFDDERDGRPGDFQILYPRLRTTKAQTEFIASFNTAPVHEGHWIMKYFFLELYKGDEGHAVNPPLPPEVSGRALQGGDFASGHLANEKHPSDNMVRLPLTMTSVPLTVTPARSEIRDPNSEISYLTSHISYLNTTYLDNYFIDKPAYYANLQLASGGNPDLLRAIAEGAWGVTDNKNPWLYAFDASKHVQDHVPILRNFPVHLSFDFNNDPFACTAWQMSPEKGGRNNFVHAVKEFTGCMKIEDMCQRIKTTFPAAIFHITGDRSGQNEDLGRNQTLYQMIAAQLGVSQKQLNLNRSNLEHADSRLFINALFHAYPQLHISREGCPNLVHQCQLARVDHKTSKPSQLLKDRGLYKMDEFDSMRYFFQTYFHEYARKTYFKV